MTTSKIMGIIACSSLALDGIARALGATPQRVFTEDWVFVWWLVAVSWIGFAIGMFYEQ